MYSCYPATSNLRLYCIQCLLICANYAVIYSTSKSLLCQLDIAIYLSFGVFIIVVNSFVKNYKEDKYLS
jgi:hypothetical protein